MQRRMELVVAGEFVQSTSLEELGLREVRGVAKFAQLLGYAIQDTLADIETAHTLQERDDDDIVDAVQRPRPQDKASAATMKLYHGGFLEPEVLGLAGIKGGAAKKVVFNMRSPITLIAQRNAVQCAESSRSGQTPVPDDVADDLRDVWDTLTDLVKFDADGNTDSLLYQWNLIHLHKGFEKLCPANGKGRIAPRHMTTLKERFGEAKVAKYRNDSKLFNRFCHNHVGLAAFVPFNVAGGYGIGRTGVLDTTAEDAKRVGRVMEDR